MGEPVIIYGKSGSGKSRSLKGFAPDEIFFVNVVGKRLPFPAKFKYEYKSADVGKIKGALKKMPVKTAVIDDAGYLMTSTFMSGHSQPKQGSSAFDLYNNIGDQMWELFNSIKYDLPDDVIVYINFHEISNDIGETKIRTIGKLLDEKVCLEGLVTICLHCMTSGGKHFFRTQSDGNDISKSPEGLFDLEIENDLKAVDNKIRAFWDMGGGDNASD